MLPRRLRWMAATCALVSALTMWGATRDLFAGVRLSALREELDKTTAPDYTGELMLHMARAELSAWTTMRGPRIAISIFVSLAAGLAFAASLRLVMPMGLRRDAMRALLTRALVWTAGTRTIAGAADTGAFRYAAESLKKHQASIPGKEAFLAQLPEADRKAMDEFFVRAIDGMPSAAVVMMIGWTLAMTALFVMYWRYFSRDDVRDALIAADDAPPPSA